MTLANLTQGQKNELYKSLTIQKNEGRELTPNEAKVLKELEAAKMFLIDTEQGYLEINEAATKVRVLNFDDCGANLKRTWATLKQNTKGEFFNLSYFGSKRVYTDGAKEIFFRNEIK